MRALRLLGLVLALIPVSFALGWASYRPAHPTPAQAAPAPTPAVIYGRWPEPCHEYDKSRPTSHHDYNGELVWTCENGDGWSAEAVKR